jgi:hypothetical protein
LPMQLEIGLRQKLLNLQWQLLPLKRSSLLVRDSFDAIQSISCKCSGLCRVDEGW